MPRQPFDAFNSTERIHGRRASAPPLKIDTMSVKAGADMKRRMKTTRASKQLVRKPKRTRRTRSVRKGKPPLQNQNETLKRELREAREQQAATAEVLKVIFSSAGELEPVFNAVLEKATHICEAQFGILFRYEGNETFSTSALFNAPPALTEARRRESLFRPAANTAIGRMRLTKRPIHIAGRAWVFRPAARLLQAEDRHVGECTDGSRGADA
jgi:hypothetical protein